MINNAIATVEHLNQLHEGFTDETVVLNVLPLYHSKFKVQQTNPEL